MYRKKSIIYRVWYYPQFQASTGEGPYNAFPQKGDYSLFPRGAVKGFSLITKN